MLSGAYSHSLERPVVEVPQRCGGLVAADGSRLHGGPRDLSPELFFPIDTGVGVEYPLSEKVFLGTQMMFNFLPKVTKNEGFIFAWQIAGIRFAF